MSRMVLLRTWLWLLTVGPLITAVLPAQADPIRLHPENPHYYHLNKVLAFDETGGSDVSDRKYRTEGWDWLIAGGGVYNHLDFSFTTDCSDGTAVPLPSGTPGGGGPELRRQLQVLKEFNDID